VNKVLVYLAPGFEEIEAVTIIDLLRRAEIDVTVAGLEEGAITGSHDIKVLADLNYENVDPNEFDYLILPGGQPGTNNLKNNQKVLNSIKLFMKDNKLIGAICAAPTVLQEAGILDNKKVTSYPSEKQVFDSSIYDESPVVKDDNIITSRGVGTAIDFTLDLIGEIKGNEVKQKTAKKILWKINK
jgi:4-methyl-5(b-hydroxyethyl)-thiazole monophosphate biosynthesis